MASCSGLNIWVWQLSVVVKRYSTLVIVTPGYYDPPFIVNTTPIPCTTPIKNCKFSLLL